MDLMEFAINMEVEGEKFYRNQAMLNEGNNLHGMFVSLADDEKMHASVLRKKSKEHAVLPKSNIPDDLNIYKNEEYFKSEYKEIPAQLDFYHKALAKEKESIDLYKKLRNDIEESSDLFDYLIGQETKHHQLIYDLITLLERVESWVESPEFGLREDY